MVRVAAGMLHRLLPTLVCGTMLAGCATIEARMYDLQQFAPDTLVGSQEAPGLQLSPLVTSQRNVFTRSYHIGESYTSSAGEAMISVKNYTVTERVGRATALSDFEHRCGRELISREPIVCRKLPLAAAVGKEGAGFSVTGAVRAPDGDFFAVSMPAPQGTEIYLLVDRRGFLRKGAYVIWRESEPQGYSVGPVPFHEVIPDPALEDSRPLFSFDKVERFIGSGPGYLNFDVVYSGFRPGSRSDHFVLTYREYGRDATERATFTQVLPFALSSSIIDIMGLRVQVESASDQTITFRVLQDAQSAGR